MAGKKHRLSELDENQQEETQILQKRQRKGKQVEQSDCAFDEDEDGHMDSDSEVEVDAVEKDEQELVAGPGSIESVELFNFMCHTRLSTRFGKNINFLTGPNGSGKSAVLTALAVALGSKTSFTNRGSSLSSLIKEGESVGEIIVRIRNTGIMAYRPEEYGDIIQIVRTLNRQGSGGYKIKSKKGQTISSRKVDLMKILDHFQIAVDNPMAILTQDTARLFLANSTSGQKYEFFMKGTELSTLKNKLIELESNIEEIKDNVERKQELLPDMRAEVKEMQKKWDDMRAAEKHEETLQALNGELVWSKLVQLEETKNEHEEEMNEHLEKYKDAEKKLRSEEAKLSTFEQSMSDIRAREQNAKDSLKPIEASINSMKPKLSELSRNLKESIEEVNALKNQIADAKTRETTAQEALSRERQKQSFDQKGLEEARNRDIAAIEQEMRASQDDFDNATDDFKKVEGLIQRETAETNLLGKEGSDLSREIADLKKNLSLLQNRGNRIEAYGGANLARAIKDVEQYTQERRWHGQPPIGPFGLYVQLKKSDCRKVVESILNHLLNGFGVDNPDDERLLQGIFNRHSCRNTIYKFKESRTFNSDFQAGRPDRDYETIYDVLEVTNDIVFQQLVIHNKIESVVLVKDHHEGDHVTQRNSYIPPRVTRVCTYDCYEVANSSGGRSTTLLNRYNGPSRFAENVEVEKENFKRQLQEKELRIRKVKELHDNLKSKVYQLNRDKAGLADIQRTASEAISRFRSRIGRIQQSVEEQDATNVPMYESMLNEVREEVATLQGQMPDLLQKSNDDRAMFEELKVEYENYKRDLITEKSSVEAIQNEMKDFSRTSAKLDSSITHYRRKFTQHEREFKENKQIFDRTQEVYLEKEKQCLSFCARVETKRSEQDIRADIRKMVALVKQAETEFGSRDQFYKLFKVKYDNLKAVEEEVENFALVIDTLKAAYEKRSNAGAVFQRSITNRCKMLFGNFVHRRGFRGFLDINHETKNLVLRIVADGETMEVDDCDPKSLSGGEKSFAQICLLLSLWSSMYTPFRCLDEFDVFMDAVNRRLAVKLLIFYARNDGNASQFLLISPQNTAHLNELSGPDIQVLKMNAPERGQTQLNFTAATTATAAV